MPLLSELSRYIDPTLEDYSNPEAFGENLRPHTGVSEEVGRRTIAKVQPQLQSWEDVPGQFFSNLASDVGEFASGTFALAALPFRHPREVGSAILHPIETAEKIGSAVAGSYKESYTPKEDESVPGMILRRFYEKPFSTLMDASALGQAAFGGAGLAARAATAGVRGAAEGAAAARVAGSAMAGRAFAEIPEAAAVAQRAASADRTIDLMARATERAKRLDPISMAMDAGTYVLKTKVPDVYAAIQTTRGVTDKMADRTAVQRAAESQHTMALEDAFGDLNPAERLVIWPYVSGRVNFDRPVGEQLMTHTGEWVPVKGDVIRPDALEDARQKYIPIQQELEFARGLTPGQVAQEMGAKSMNDARKFLGPENFDPLHPQVQEFVVDNVTSALRKNDEYLKARQTGEMRTALDIAKEKSWRAEMDAAVASNLYESEKDAMSALPRPERTTVDEALRLMGPQGGIYWPHSAEAMTRDQSTIRNVLTKLGEASTFKENEYALFAAGAMENQDPVRQLLRAFSTFHQNKSWLQMGYEAAEQGVKDGTVTRMPKTWSPNTDPDVIAGTHQSFHPGRMMTDDLVEESGQRMLTRLLEVIDSDGPPKAAGMTIDASTGPVRSNATGPYAGAGLPAGVPVGNINFSEIMRGLVEQADKGPIYVPRKEIPIYKIPTSMGHSLKQIRDSLNPPTNPLSRIADNFSQWWNWANLNLRMTRLNNNIMGNTGFAAMQGLHPFTPRGLNALIAAGRAMGSKLGVTSSEEAARLAKVFDLPGVRGGTLQTSLSQASGTVGARLAESRFLPARLVGGWSERLARWNQNVESAYRGASLFYELSPNAIGRAQKMLGHATDTMSLGEKIEQFAKAGGDVTMANPEYRKAIQGVNRFFHNYDRTTPFERTTIRRIFPYYKFWKHSTELITRYPFEHPVKGAMMRAMGGAALQDVKDTLKQWGMDWNRDVPPHLQDSIPVMRENDPVTGKPVVWMFNTKGPNPFSQMNGYMSEQALQMLNPVVKIAIEQATGINLFTRERYRGAISSYTGREVDPKTGQIVDSFNHPSFPESFLRSFWPYQTARELVSQGRVPTDTASLLMMATNAPNAWQIDERGFPRRRPQRVGYQALARAVGPVPQALEEPSPAQRSVRKATVNTQLNTLLQRHPERRQEILDAIESTAQDVINESQ